MTGPQRFRCEGTTVRGKQCMSQACHCVRQPERDPVELFLCQQHWDRYMTEKGFPPT